MSRMTQATPGAAADTLDELGRAVAVEVRPDRGVGVLAGIGGRDRLIAPTAFRQEQERRLIAVVADVEVRTAIGIDVAPAIE